MDEIKIWKEDGWYIVQIPFLGVVDQAPTIKELKKELKEAVELSVESIVKDELKLKGKRASSLKKFLINTFLIGLNSRLSLVAARGTKGKLLVHN